jgi:hypothetical protein
MKKGYRLDSPFSIPSFVSQEFVYAAPIDRLAWKHSLQNTGRP